ncbi:MSCRAMM family protein [Actinomycetospora termitidis]|uniref:Carboxypeptidase regulatory-like domain-containing protein n=1 Tax=Actinomycetospora termitidis TaxID=3053470 RepID=A0ABT7MAM4_9PSEU|nr:carboxypeptidase regulatory-like domain-containing protein [Actinomycetospora sp. Odt1-22]MDL5157711.1 carboxypeptidase regulatory-like domain-containing protein [Actinomycetospora sp. Odt1-22]
MDGQQPIMIFGRITRGDGGPLPGAALTLCDLAGDQLDRTTTDEAGDYRLTPSTGGTYLVICSSSTHQPKASLVAVADRPLRHDVSLTGGGATLEGTVGASREGTVVGTAGVVLTLTDVRGTVVAVARSNADGGYRFADLDEGSYTLTAAAPDTTPVAETVQVPGEGRVVRDISLVSQLRLTGVVRSASGGRPVAEALATLVGADGNVVGAAVTGTDGTFDFPEVAPGTYTITASGYAPVASEIEVGTGRPSEVTLTLTPPALGPADDWSGPSDDVTRSFSGEDFGADAVPAGAYTNGHNGRHSTSADGPTDFRGFDADGGRR